MSETTLNKNIFNISAPLKSKYAVGKEGAKCKSDMENVPQY